MPTPRSHDKLLSMQLGLPIHSCRGSLLLFSARDIVGFLAKHIVCRDMNEQPVHLLHHHCQVRRRLGIEFLRQGHIGLSSIDIRIGSTIYDGINLILRNHATHSRQIGNIQIEGLQLVCLANIRKDIMVNTILSNEAHLIAIGNRKHELEATRHYVKSIDEALKSHTDTIEAAEKEIQEWMRQLEVADLSELPDKEALQTSKAETTAQKEEIIGQEGSIRKSLADNNANIARRDEAKQKLDEATTKHARWELINRYFGGTRFRTLVQTYILRPLLNNANIYLRQITDRYELTCSEDNAQLSILVHDLYNKGQVRSATILSGGERFMISLALSLALSSLNRSDMNVNILFIDEGFGTLDEKSLESVMVTLEKLQKIMKQYLAYHLDVKELKSEGFFRDGL